MTTIAAPPSTSARLTLCREGIFDEVQIASLDQFADALIEIFRIDVEKPSLVWETVLERVARAKVA